MVNGNVWEKGKAGEIDDEETKRNQGRKKKKNNNYTFITYEVMKRRNKEERILRVPSKKILKI